ncbi:hypothetical protein [Uliginosibacterium sp. H1]|uniref:hypothetical protein n=1 Tax=Uliginosibacterium sp. H1 TaxID=3114757 RepID=UPI002E170265|nr:hypothetical protein [Uliginosibacterium sp. H1]
MARRILLGLLLLCASSWALAQTSPAVRFTYPPPETANDQRHLYYWQVLEAALASNRDKYGDFAVEPYATPMTFQRAAAEVETGKGRVNIVARATNLDLETRLRPIRLPLDKGLLGARLFLVTQDTAAKLEKVRTLEELQQYTIGQNSAWTDVKILQNAGFKVVIADDYEGLFQMLSAKRFDLFSRGAIEIDAEWKAHRDTLPNLVIDRSFMLYYPLPRYFFVPRTAEGEKMAERIEDGLRRLQKSGEFERRYQDYKRLVLKDVSLAGRRVFRLTNTQLSPETPLSDKYWWDDLSAELNARSKP